MLKELIAAINDVPEYIRAVIYGPHLIYAIIAGVIFIVVLLITNRFTNILRKIFVYASIVVAAYAFFTKRYALFWVSILFLGTLLLFRFIRFLIIYIQETVRNRRIEKRALARARERRGSFEKKKGYSGDYRPVEDNGTAAPEHTPAPQAAEISRAEMNEAIQSLKKLHEMGILTEMELAEKTALVYEKMG